MRIPSVFNAFVRGGGLPSEFYNADLQQNTTMFDGSRDEEKLDDRLG